MKGHQVIISLGSNLGNKQEYIEKAIDLINNNIGSVFKLSSIYETPSWGFDSESFYNAVIVIQTYYDAEKILSDLLKIETTLGRKRNQKINSYQARTIDLDIVSFDHDIIETESLKIPHPLMHKRAFVMLPLCEIYPDWNHPKFDKNLKQLLNESEDGSEVKIVSSITSATTKLKNISNKNIVIEGIIGSGKTTLTDKLAIDFEMNTLFESFSDNPFLASFYENPDKYALPLELSFLMDRHQQIENFKKNKKSNIGLVADYDIHKSLIFSSFTLSNLELKLYKKIFQTIQPKLCSPDLFIYLDIPIHTAIENIAKRGRVYEKNISEEYLKKLQSSYQNYLDKLPDTQKLILDCKYLDFVSNPSDYQKIIKMIDDKLK